MAQNKWAMIIDVRRCIGCQACTVACKSENKVPLGVFRTHVKFFETGTYPNAKRRFLPMLCMQCGKPPCIKACPVKATYKRSDGVVLINYEKCIGCGYCVDACPYDARYLNTEKVDTGIGGKIEWGGKRPYGKADKCTFCAHRIEKGIVPACVNTCVGGARQFGDLKDSKSKVSKLKRSILAGNKQLSKVSDKYGPLQLGGLSVFYILPATQKDYHLPNVSFPSSFNAKNIVKIVGAIAAAGTVAGIGLSYISSSFDKESND